MTQDRIELSDDERRLAEREAAEARRKAEHDEAERERLEERERYEEEQRLGDDSD